MADTATTPQQHRLSDGRKKSRNQKKVLQTIRLAPAPLRQFKWWCKRRKVTHAEVLETFFRKLLWNVKSVEDVLK